MGLFIVTALLTSVRLEIFAHLSPPLHEVLTVRCVRTVAFLTTLEKEFSLLPLQTRLWNILVPDREFPSYAVLSIFAACSGGSLSFCISRMQWQHVATPHVSRAVSFLFPRHSFFHFLFRFQHACVSPHIHVLSYFPFLLLHGVKGLVFSLLLLLCSPTELSFIGLQCDYKTSLRGEMLWSSRDACAKSMVRSLLCPWEMVEPCGQLHSQIISVGHTLEQDPETSTFLFL